MIHETLFYLLNCPVNVLGIHDVEGLPDILELQDFIHPSEKKLLQRILAVGSSYHWIESFIKSVKDQNIINLQINIGKDSVIKFEDKVATECVMPGLYVKAFCQGVDECLEDYRRDIVKLEELFLTNCSINLTYILGCVEKYVILFDALKSMIYMIQCDNIKGCQIIGKLQRYVESGTESVNKATTKIIQFVNVIFFRQLCNWIIYGDLLDINDEFFICDGKDVDENFVNGDLSHQEVTTFSDTAFDYLKNSKLKRPFPIRRFFVREELFPFDNSKHLAEVILFIGQIVWIISNGPKEKNKDKLNFRYKRDVWEGKDVLYYQKLQKLEKSAINITEFEATIEECRLTLAKYLWNIMVKEANLLEHLQLVRDYYCLGRGELFQQFIISAENRLKDNPSTSTVANINYIFKETARKLYGDNDKTHKKFELALAKIQDKNYNDPLLSLEVNFEVKWPLHIIFHPKTLKLYNKLFCYLLRIKKTHIDLHKLWLLHIHGKRKINPMVWNLRNTLMFIVNNIQYYLQVDVIESQFSILKGSFKNAHEFGQIARHHSMFLSNLLSKTFLLATEEDSDQGNKQQHSLYQSPALIYGEGENLVYKVILQILQLCDKFCFLVSTWENNLHEPELKQLEEMKEECETLMQVLLRVLYNLHERISGLHLLQLLHRLDFNRWFSKIKDLPLTSN